jgi:hypothetical protein
MYRAIAIVLLVAASAVPRAVAQQLSAGYETLRIEDEAWKRRIHLDIRYPTTSRPEQAAALMLAGAMYNAPDLASYCRSIAAPSDKGCLYPRGSDEQAAPSAVPVPLSRRLAALVALDPAAGPGFSEATLHSITVPSLVIGSVQNDFLPFAFHAGRVAAHVPAAQVDRLDQGEGHFVYLDVCMSSLEALGVRLCSDRPGVDRNAVHETLRRAIEQFLTRSLPARTPGLDAPREQAGPSSVLSRVDHLVYATPDLERGIDRIEQLLGLRATPGGQHPGRGTRNALVALGPSSYLEIIGPDPEQPTPAQPRPFGIDDLKEPRLVTWAAKGEDLDAVARSASRNGVKLGEVIAGSRRRADDVLLTWRYTDPRTVVANGVVPFVIDWGQTPHPATTATPGATLVELRVEHPEAQAVQNALKQLGLDLRVQQGPRVGVTATIDSPRGRVELR